MLRLISLLGVFFVTLSLLGCATTRFDQSMVQASAIPVGHLDEVVLRLTDQRPGVVSKKPSLLDPVIQSALDNNTDVLRSYRPKIIQMLQENQFVPVMQSEHLERSLQLSLTSLRYTAVDDSLFDGAQIKAMMQVRAVNGKAVTSETFEQTASVGLNFGHTHRQIKEAVKRAMNKLIVKIIDNSALMDFLSKK